MNGYNKNGQRTRLPAPTSPGARFADMVSGRAGRGAYQDPQQQEFMQQAYLKGMGAETRPAVPGVSGLPALPAREEPTLDEIIALMEARGFDVSALREKGVVGTKPTLEEGRVVEVGGRKVLIDPRTGKTIKDLGAITPKERGMQKWQHDILMAEEPEPSPVRLDESKRGWIQMGKEKALTSEIIELSGEIKDVIKKGAMPQQILKASWFTKLTPAQKARLRTFTQQYFEWFKKAQKGRGF